MGMLVEGVWVTDDGGFAAKDGHFKRSESTFRDWVTADGEPGPQGQRSTPAEAGRYRLYVSLACPWAHRALIVRAVNRLESLVPLSIVHWHMGDQGWGFAPGPDVTPDPEQGAAHLHQLYAHARPGMTGKATVPVLWDRTTQTIVNNESSDILRILDTAFVGLGAPAPHLYPSAHRDAIDALNTRVYDTLNNGVYKAGFATTQDAYEQAVRPLFDTLDWLDQRLQDSQWLVADTFTEADIRLFTTLIRFDPVYFGHFKCNVRRVVDYPALHRFVARMMARPEIAATVNMAHIKNHYYQSHRQINPSGVVPVGPDALY